ncbi:flagellar basal-body rod protein FlgF [Croceibacterium mercuriale]|uniref:Flagellar basal-body rod protein FlgF n=1 Tax=Croceibacterium mercuriale TaxID=1572751 RepID=A0A0B2BZZ1_9SPHN|nr:flagellar basal body rod protein FlgF [Croceibacterium mercuriale]KHL25597.1 flagellar basal-body rod protein FlgF [Croceibacterium mercuriale]
MDRLIYTALSGMRASMDQQRVTASNMANAQTIGFRAEELDRRPVTLRGEALEVRAMQKGEVRGADMRAGEVVQTGNPLDVALNGDALLAVQAPDGSEAYTRRGDLTVDAAGMLTNGEGFLVLGADGPISLPPNAQPQLAADGSITVRDPAQPAAPPQDAGRIKLASATGSQVLKGLDGLFRVVGGGMLPADEQATLVTAALEQSNVNSSEVLVEMIDAQRLFAMRTKLIATAGELDESGASLMRLG